MSSGFRIPFGDTCFVEAGKVAAFANRLNWRAEVLLSRNRALLAGKRVLDLACHDGRFSYAALELGAEHVTGIEGRTETVVAARRKLASSGHDDSRWEFIAGDVFDHLGRFDRGRFDTILCLGWLYHTIRQVELIREFRRLDAAHVILDTLVLPDPLRDPLVRGVLRLRRLLAGPWRVTRRPHGRGVADPYVGSLVLAREDNTHPGATIDPLGVAARPTRGFLEFFLQQIGTERRELVWRDQGIVDWTALIDYRDGQRVSWISSR